MIDRRHFINSTALALGGILVKYSRDLLNIPFSGRIAVQQYTWYSYLQREGITWNDDLPGFLSQLESNRIPGFEPSFNNAEEARILNGLVEKSSIWSNSMYVNSTLHDPEKIKESITNALSIAAIAKQMGIRIVVTNPSPIQWGNPIDKTDDQLLFQAKNLDRLGKELRKMGMKLAYHTHDMEMRQSAREFHHMMLNTRPDNVHLCLDSHWVYRGSGNSQLALFDIIKLYGERIVELHLRQSQDGIWSEVFGEGDIDHDHMVGLIAEKKTSPHIVFEQAVEEGTPMTVSSTEAIISGLAHVEEVCAPLL